jgi:Fe-S-cluster containining protein
MTYPPTNDKFLNKDNFNCTKCGQCCRPIVLVNKEEILKIEELGLKQKEFVDVDPLNEDEKNNALKQVNGVCMFLKRKDEEYYCSIYNHRPSICRKYPFFENEKLKDCRPPRWNLWMDLKDLVKEST